MSVSLVDPDSSQPLSVAQAAAQYQALGLSVLPWLVTPNKNGGFDKTPKKSFDTHLVAPMSAAEITRWWQAQPNHNVGIITGPTGTQVTGRFPLVRPTDVVVLDLDTPRALAWADLHLPDTPWVVRSGRASGVGEHRGYRYPTNVPKGRWIAGRAGLLGISGLDIRGFNGFVAMPPSIHASGQPYQWVSRPRSVTDLPVFDIAWFEGCDLLNREAEDTPDDDQPEAPARDVQLAQQWLAKQPPAVENRVSPGSNGERQTFKVCARLRRGFGLNLQQALQVLEPWNAQCQPPWEQEGLVRKLNDAYSGGDEPLGQAAKDARNAESTDTLLASLATSTAKGAVPAAPKAAELEQAKTLCLALPGQSTDDPGAPYTAEAIAAAICLWYNDMPSFVRLREELKTVKVTVREWEKHVHSSRREAQVIHRLELGDSALLPVVVGPDERQLIADVIAALAKAPSVFFYGQTLVSVQGTNVTPLYRDTTRNAILLACKPIKKVFDKTGGYQDATTQLPMNVPGMVDNALPEQLTAFRKVRNILRVPFCAPSNDHLGHRLVTVPTYDQATQTILSETPEIRLDNHPTTADALGYLRWIFSDFPFESETDWCNYLGAMLQIIVRPSIHGPTPLHVIEASQERGGKTLLAKVLLLLAGVDPPTMTTLRNKSDMIPQDIFAAVRDGRPVQFWDNVTEVVDSPDLASLLTSTMFTARILRSSSTQTVPCEQLWGLTSNNALLSAELAKRTVRMRLLTIPTTIQKNYKIPDLLTYVRQHRGDILSALCRLVQHWIDLRSPKAPAHVWLEGYESWVRVVGGICHSCGANSWLVNRHGAAKQLAAHSEWEPFCNAWWDAHGEKPCTVRDLLALSSKFLLLSAVRGDGSDASQMTKLGVQLRKQHQAYHGDYQILSVEQRAQGTLYKLLKTNVVPLTRATAVG